MGLSEIMENTGYIVLSRQMAIRREIDVIANNIANMNTTGYKNQNMMFTEHLMGEQGESPVRMVMDYGQFSKVEQGPLRQTGNTYDMALSGPGFFEVAHKATGETYYTRAGNFTLNNNNELVNAAGHLVQGVNGNIQIPAEARDITITEDGTITSSEGELGQIKTVEFENPQNMRIVGQGLWDTAQPAQEGAETKISQGVLEGSNVEPVLEMTRMIEASRLYQMNQNMLKNEHDRIRNAINKLSNLNN